LFGYGNSHIGSLLTAWRDANGLCFVETALIIYEFAFDSHAYCCIVDVFCV